MSVPEGYDPSTGYMDFSLALREMKKGKKVRRAGWSGTPFYLEIKDGAIWTSGIGKTKVLDHEVLATDWEEVL